MNGLCVGMCGGFGCVCGLRLCMSVFMWVLLCVCKWSVCVVVDVWVCLSAAYVYVFLGVRAVFVCV